MEKKLFEPHYDVIFKKKVVEEYLTTACPKMFLIRKYNIQFKSAIQTWLRTLGYTDPYSSATLRKAKFEPINFNFLSSKKLSETNDDPQVLKKRIEQLEKELLDEKLRSEAYKRIIEKAEKELNIPIRKKPFTR